MKGVYRSTDGGAHWTQISPQGSHEIHEVESVAIDPADPKIIYAGTWHLPWKTTDGGANWHNIKQGVIDDSDVFSIIIDPQQPTSFTPAPARGIYKSDNAGEIFHKRAGNPEHRPAHPRADAGSRSTVNIVYAGTTEGLYRPQTPEQAGSV